jgi:hypothetical protein
MVLALELAVQQRRDWNEGRPIFGRVAEAFETWPRCVEMVETTLIWMSNQAFRGNFQYRLG